MSEDNARTRQAETRKLAAIMFTDIVGFSRQMGANEARMLRLLEIHNQIIQQAVAEHHGHVIKSTGDGFLVDFPSVVHAVQCAQQLQARFRVHNAEKEPAEQIHIRIGIHLGDIVQQDGDVQGDGVNIAARLQPLAEPDTICISDMVYRDVAKKLDLGTVVSLGRPKLKNIAQRFPVYLLCPEPPTGVRQTLGVQWLKLTRRMSTAPRAAVAAVLLALVSAGTLALRHLYFPSSPRLLLPDKPSLAVLPFVNMSSDPEQEYFSDGMTDTLITDLSKLAGLFVIARTSTFVYKGKAINPQQVSQELGVRYVVEGSMQKADTQVRITVQLVEATTGHHLWAERYDRELKDIFALQDELARRIVGALQVKLTTGEQGRIGRVPTDNLEAYDYYLRGLEYAGRSTKEAYAQAQQMFERAIGLDPQFAQAYMALGWTHVREWDWVWSLDPQVLEQALALAHQAIALDNSLAGAHSLLGIVYAQNGQSEQGLAEGERAIALDPNCAECYVDLAVILNFTGRPEETFGLVEKAMRLDPQSAADHSEVLGWAYRLLGRYEEAMAAQKRTLARNPNLLYAHVELARIYHEVGRVEEAQVEEATVRRLSPYFPLEELRHKAALKEQEEDVERIFKRSLTDNLKARAYFFGGFGYFLRWTQEAQAQAQQMWEHAIELDPQFAAGHAMLGWTYLLEWNFQWSQEPETLERALTLARKAVALDEAWPMAHQLLGLVYLYKKQHERAIVEGEQAIALNPDDADGYRHLGSTLTFVGRPEEGIGLLKKGIHLKPRFPAFHFATLGWAYYLTGRYEDALDTLKQALPLNPQWLPTHVYLAVTYSEVGREEEARAELAEVLRLSPNFSLEGVKQRLPFQDPAVLERMFAALRKAGLK